MCEKVKKNYTDTHIVGVASSVNNIRTFDCSFMVVHSTVYNVVYIVCTIRDSGHWEDTR
jgi:hypothetical protein